MARATPHDALFKSAFREADAAASLLRALLPPSFAAQIDASNLTLEPGSFVDEALRERHSDLLYSCLLNGSEVLIYFLLEHQSTVDPLMAYRVARYVDRILEQWLRGHEGAQRLPVVLPIVVYNGATPWTAPTDLRDLFDLPGAARPALEPLLPSVRFILDDLARQDEADLGRRALTTFAEIALRALKQLPRSPDPVADLQRWLGLLRALLAAPRGLSKLAALVEYLRRVADVDDEALRTTVAQLGPAAEEVTVTAAERLRREGLDEGRRTQAAMLVSMLEARFGAVPDDVRARIEAADTETLERWGVRLVTADALEDVLD